MAYTETALYADSVAYAAVATWAATHAYSIGNIVRQLAAPTAGNERCFVCILAGTSLASEPAWGASPAKGVIITEAAGPKWQECTALPALNGDGTNTNPWRASQGTVTLGTVIKNVAATHYFICTVSGTGGTGSEPSWNTTAGATTTDSGATWTCIGPVGNFTTRWAAPAARLGHLMNNNSSWVANANMVIYVGDDHSGAAITGSYRTPSQCSVICIDHTAALPAGAAALRATAAIADTVGASYFNGVGNYVYGLQITFNVVANFSIGTAAQQRGRFEQCLFSFTTSNTGVAFYVGDNTGIACMLEFNGCTFHYQVAAQYITTWAASIKFERCSFTGTLGGSGNQVFGRSVYGSITCEGCDFSNVASGGALVGPGAAGSPNAYYCFKDCIVPSGVTAVRGITSLHESLLVDLVRCDSGGTNYRNERHSNAGDETTTTTIVRTGGASDGTTPVAHQVVTTANASNAIRVFTAIALAASNTVTATNRNVTCYGIANDSRVPNNDEVWFDVEYLGSASSPQGSFARGGKVPLATAAALTADTSAWDSAATARANSTAYVVGDVRKVASNSGRVFFCTTAGTTAGSEPGGYASAVDGGSVTDGTAVFRAGCRFKQTLTLSSPQPAQAGYVYAYPKFGRASTTYVIDPAVYLS